MSSVGRALLVAAVALTGMAATGAPAAAQFAALPGAPQAADTARTGQRIKLLLDADTVQGHPRQMLFGNLLSKSADSVRIDLGAGTSPLSVAVTGIDRIYVSRGVPTRQQSATGGAIGGAVVGAGFGILLTLVSDAGFWDILRHTFLDASLGAALGALLPQESWKRVAR